MPGTILSSSARVLVSVALLGLVSCSQSQSTVPPRTIKIQQTWQLQPGSTVAGRRVTGGLGDVSIELGGGTLYAPFNGRVQPHQSTCIIFSSPEVPAYLLRLCGVQHPKLGDVRVGETLGAADTLQVAALRKQPDGTWAMVEPSVNVLSQTLTPP